MFSMPGGPLYVHNIGPASVKRKFHCINAVQHDQLNTPSHVLFQKFSFVFAGRCGRELELCGCLWSMLLFSVNKVVVQVCLDFGRSVIFFSPNVNMCSKVQENCITLFPTLNTAHGSAAIKQTLHPIRRYRLFRHCERKKQRRK